MTRFRNKSLPYRVVFDVVVLLGKDFIGGDDDRHVRLFPDSIFAGRIGEEMGDVRFGGQDVAHQLVSSKLFEITDKTGDIRGGNDQMEMIEHEDPSEDLQALL